MSMILCRQGDNRTLSDFKNIVEYCTDPIKTKDKSYTYTFGCITDDPLSEMIEVKRINGKASGRQYIQTIISPTPVNNHVSDEEFMEMAKETGQHYYNLGYQCVVSVHFDTGKRHFHLVINTVSLHNAKKFSQSISQLNRFKLHSNHILEKYGFDIVKSPTEKMLDDKSYSFKDGYDFLEAFDMIAEDIAFNFYSVIWCNCPVDYTITKPLPKNYNPDAPKRGCNQFIAAESETYRDYFKKTELGNPSLDTYNSWAPKGEMQPMAPFDSANTTPVITIKDKTPEDYGVIDYFEGTEQPSMHIDARRIIDVDVPNTVSPMDIDGIVNRIDSRSKQEQNDIIRNASAAKAGLHRTGDESSVSLDMTERIRIHFKDGNVISHDITKKKRRIKEFPFKALAEYDGPPLKSPENSQNSFIYANESNTYTKNPFSSGIPNTEYRQEKPRNREFMFKALANYGLNVPDQSVDSKNGSITSEIDEGLSPSMNADYQTDDYK